VTEAVEAIVLAAIQSNDPVQLAEALATVDAATPDWGDAMADHLRGRLLGALGRHEEALSAQLAAIGRDESLAAAHYSAGVLLADLGREEEAAQHWARAAALDPDQIDALYNLAQYHYDRGEFEPALDHWQAAMRLAPDDVEILKKIVQAERALERWDDANHSMQRLVDAWNRSPDPQVRALNEVVTDQFLVGGLRVMAAEMLRPANPALHHETTFRLFDRTGKPVMSVQLESSQYGRERGVPYVIGVTTPAGHRTTGQVFTAKPSYQILKPLAIALMQQAAGGAGGAA